MNNKLVLAALLAMAILAFSLSVALVDGQTDEPAEMRFDIQVYDVDLSTLTAQINITIMFTNLSIVDLQLGENITAIIVSEVDNVKIKCNQANEDGTFVGSSGMISWTLGGELGKGEYFPFEEYELVFRLANILPGPFDMTKVEYNMLYSFVYFEGPKKTLLVQIFQVTSNHRKLLDTALSGNLTAISYLSRKLGGAPFHLPSLFWPLIAPTLACLYLLVSTLLLTGDNALGNRLRVYVSLFIFAPSFLMAIQGYLPLRASLSIPEVLLENLLISTAVFTILSLLNARSVIQELIRDGAILFFSLFSTSFFLSHLMPLYPTSAHSVFFYTIAAYAVVAFSIWNYRCVDEFLESPRDVITIIYGMVGIFFIGFGFSLVAFYFILPLVIVYGAICGVFGVVFLVYQMRYKRRVWYWMFPPRPKSYRRNLRAVFSLLKEWVDRRIRHGSRGS